MWGGGARKQRQSGQHAWGAGLGEQQWTARWVAAGPDWERRCNPGPSPLLLLTSRLAAALHCRRQPWLVWLRRNGQDGLANWVPSSGSRQGAAAAGLMGAAPSNRGPATINLPMTAAALWGKATHKRRAELLSQRGDRSLGYGGKHCDR